MFPNVLQEPRPDGQTPNTRLRCASASAPLGREESARQAKHPPTLRYGAAGQTPKKRQAPSAKTVHGPNPRADHVEALRARLFVVSAILAFACFCAAAKEHPLSFLKEGQPDVAALLTPPPRPDSPEQAADMNTVRAVYHAASSGEIAAAYSEKKFSVFNFTPEVGAYFQSNALPRTAAFFKKVQADAATVTDAQKDFFARPRPYSVDTNLVNGKLEKTFSYPSGHATESMVLALVLADLVPEKREAILARSRAIGWHRVQIARHYPTDIYAGYVLAQAIVRQMKESEAFKAELRAAQAELAAARN